VFLGSEFQKDQLENVRAVKGWSLTSPDDKMQYLHNSLLQSHKPLQVHWKRQHLSETRISNKFKQPFIQLPTLGFYGIEYSAVIELLLPEWEQVAQVHIICPVRMLKVFKRILSIAKTYLEVMESGIAAQTVLVATHKIFLHFILRLKIACRWSLCHQPHISNKTTGTLYDTDII